MANYAYLRVSTHTQDVENQKLSVLDYCNSQGIAPIEFVEDTTSGRRSWRDRESGRLLETADAGDVLVAAEVSRLARSTLQVLELLQAAADRGVTVHIAKNRMVLDQSLPATITATILGSRRRSSGNLSRPGRKRRLSVAKQRDCPSVDRKAEPPS